jgi:hypothetical protein
MEHIWIKEEREDEKEDVDISIFSLLTSKVFLNLLFFLILLIQNFVYIFYFYILELNFCLNEHFILQGRACG